MKIDKNKVALLMFLATSPTCLMYAPGFFEGKTEVKRTDAKSTNSGNKPSPVENFARFETILADNAAQKVNNNQPSTGRSEVSQQRLYEGLDLATGNKIQNTKNSLVIEGLDLAASSNRIDQLNNQISRISFKEQAAVTTWSKNLSFLKTISAIKSSIGRMVSSLKETLGYTTNAAEDAIVINNLQTTASSWTTLPTTLQMKQFVQNGIDALRNLRQPKNEKITTILYDDGSSYQIFKDPTNNNVTRTINYNSDGSVKSNRSNFSEESGIEMSDMGSNNTNAFSSKESFESGPLYDNTATEMTDRFSQSIDVKANKLPLQIEEFKTSQLKQQIDRDTFGIETFGIETLFAQDQNALLSQSENLSTTFTKNPTPLQIQSSISSMINSIISTFRWKKTKNSQTGVTEFIALETNPFDSKLIENNEIVIPAFQVDGVTTSVQQKASLLPKVPTKLQIKQLVQDGIDGLRNLTSTNKTFTKLNNDGTFSKTLSDATGEKNDQIVEYSAEGRIQRSENDITSSSYEKTAAGRLKKAQRDSLKIMNDNSKIINNPYQPTIDPSNPFSSLKTRTAKELVEFLRIAPIKATPDAPITRSAVFSALSSKIADNTGLTRLRNSMKSGSPKQKNLEKEVNQINISAQLSLSKVLATSGNAVVVGLARIVSGLTKAFKELYKKFSSSDMYDVNNEKGTVATPIDSKFSKEADTITSQKMVSTNNIKNDLILAEANLISYKSPSNQNFTSTPIAEATVVDHQSPSNQNFTSTANVATATAVPIWV